MARKTVLDLLKMKAGNQKIAMVTAYDATMARIVDTAGVDMVLVGDSVGMVVQGMPDTLGVTLDDMAYHGRCVARGLQQAHLTVDLPFMSYQVSPQQALESSGRLVKEGGAQSVKLEGGARTAPAVELIVEAGIPVVGHIGLTPQSVHQLGGWRVQGRSSEAGQKLLDDAVALEQAGAFCLVLEMVPEELAAEITAAISIPHHRHRRGHRVRRPGPGLQRPAGLRQQVQAALRAPVRRARDPHGRRSAQLRRRRARRQLPRPRAQLPPQAPRWRQDRSPLLRAVMQTISDPAALQAEALRRRAQGQRIGFVPTMGFLHDGHVSLMTAARPQCDWLVVSIYVNPLQFGPNEDLDRYPRDIEGDSARCAGAGVDCIFLPPDLYDPDHSTTVSVEGLTEGLCGARRPGHFDGVTTVVARLFGLVQPTVAVFGEKDYQQLATIRRMVRDLAMPIEVQGAPLIRAADGLAMSSRNTYLSAEQRSRGLSLHRALFAMRDAAAAGTTRTADLLAMGRGLIEADRLDYLELVDAESLDPVPEVVRPARALAAGFFGTTRLIDNVAILPPGNSSS